MNDFVSGALGDAPSGLIWGLDFGEGAAHALRASEIDLSALPPGRFRWLHLNLADQWTFRWISEATRLPESARELLLGKDSHQSALVDGGITGCILQDFERDFDADDAGRVGALRFVLGPDFMITARHHPLRCADIVRAKFAAGSRVSGPAAALDLLAGAMIGAQTEIIRGLTETIQTAEDDLLDDGRSPDPRTMADVRRRAVLLHRLLEGARAVFQRLEHDDDLPEALLPAVERIVQRTAAVDADVIALQSQLRLLRDEMDSQATQRTNQNLYVLSIMTALMLPATFVTGLFGMNTGGLPWADDSLGTLLAALAAIGSAFAVWIVLRMLGLARR